MNETPSAAGRRSALEAELKAALEDTELQLVSSPSSGAANAPATLRCSNGHEFERAARSVIRWRSAICPECRSLAARLREASRLPDPATFDWIPADVQVGRGTKPRDLRGQRFGALTAIRVVGKHESGSLLWECQCECGSKTIKKSSSLCAGKASSCGCIRGTTKAYATKAPNKGRRYTIKTVDEVFSSRKAWAEAARLARGDVCEVCGWGIAPCDVHHRTPRSQGGLNTIENAIVLCPNHHREAHAVGLNEVLSSNIDAAEL